MVKQNHLARMNHVRRILLCPHFLFCSKSEFAQSGEVSGQNFVQVMENLQSHEIRDFIFHAWKVIEFNCRSWKVLEN